MKYLVETLGDYMLTDTFGQQEVAAFRPSVVKPTPFIEGNRGKKLRVLAELADEACDSSLARAKNLEEAIAALPTFEKPATAPKPKKTP